MLVVALAGARSADRRASNNGTPLQTNVATVNDGASACQTESIPADARRVRIAALADGDVQVRVAVEGDVTQRGPWATLSPGRTVVSLPRSGAGRTLCLEKRGSGTFVLRGAATGPEDRLTMSEGGSLGRARLDYLIGDGPTSFWAASFPRLAERIHAANGSSLAPWLALLGAIAAIAAGIGLVGVDRTSAQREIMLIAAMAIGSGALWAALTPMLESTDEVAHAAYVQAVGELGHPPRTLYDTGDVSQELGCWANVTRLMQVRFYTTERPPWSAGTGDPCAGSSSIADSAQYQAVQPPAFYAMAAVGYKAADIAGGTLADRLLASRLVSVLITASGVLAIFLLVRELIPLTVWPARAAAIAAALQPVVMFNLSMINSDALVAAITAWIALVLARAWKRGPTTRRALELGALYLVGSLAKLNFLTVLPIALCLQALIFLRASNVQVAARLRLIAESVAIVLVGFALYALVNSVVWDRAVRAQETNQPGGVPPRELVSYLWQTFLPPLSFMDSMWSQTRPPVVDGLLIGWTSRFGHWNDFGISSPWPTVLIAFASLLLASGIVAASRQHGGLRVTVVVGVATLACLVLAMVAIAGPSIATGSRIQPRYALPLTPVWGLAIGAAVAAVPEGWRRSATGLLGVAMLGWSVLAVGATLDRFYL